MIDKKDEALKLALEAFNEISTLYMSLPKKGCMALAAIEKVLAQPEQSYLDNFIDALKYDVAKRDSEEQQVREHAPCKGMNCGITRTDQEHSLECQAEHAAAIAGGAFVKPEQEPVDLEAVYETIIRWDIGGGKRSRRELARRIVALYTTPPHRKPLTDDDKWKLWIDARSNVLQFARAIEAAHGIKE